MAQKIYVGNLSYGTTEEKLTSIFSQYGEVLSSVIIKDRFTDQSKGFGFVEMVEADAANAAIEALNGKDLDGRRVRVNIAEDRPRNSRPPRDNFGGQGRDGGRYSYR
ncbi:MAG: RNA-binding protein [Spirochaetaceae bacterium]|jgi:RNA recognition motif-containing protein|nr:RNA-binding protein [Spirochaetaceae bacterium]